MNIARVVINLSLDREFDYLIPDHLRTRVRVGSRVRVPFGTGKRERVGYVVCLADSSIFPKLKPISAVEGEREQIPDNLVWLAGWISRYYCCAREQAVRAMLPAVVRGGKVKKKTRRFAFINPDADLPHELPKLERRAPKQAAALRYLVRSGPVRTTSLQRDTGAGPDVIRRLQKKDLIVVEERVVARDPFADDVILPSAPPQLTAEQQQALGPIHASLDSADARIFLLHGVTGSGKTEVYLRAIEHCLKLGKEAIVLVPEISLTPQTTERFRSRFHEHVSVLHSGLSDGERFDEWTKVSEGRTRIVVGARSALFAPFRQLGLIVVDEEHESTYKQDEAPRYHARDIAVVRGKREHAAVILGSATPSLESFHNARTGKYELLELTRRVDDRVMPNMELVDMRAEAALRGAAQIFSRRLEDLVRSRLDRGEQTILFLNRRGYATQMLCTMCGFVATCDDCSISYTYHRRHQQLCCHLCGRVLPAPSQCPQCKDEGIRYTGLGTEKVEALAHKLFPKASIGRMDSDTMTGKNAHKKMLTAFRSGRVQILIGTQMIAKGLDFPNVTLVGVIFADLGLFLPDFRASERTFQLLTQVAGRAGRGDVPGRVIVQSYTPFHLALQCALHHDYHEFFTDEMAARQALEFPPATHLLMVNFRGEDEGKTAAAAEAFAAALTTRIAPDVRLAVPMPAPIAKIRRFFRYQVMLRGGNTMQLVRTLRQMAVTNNKGWGAEVFVDVDPQSLL